MAPKGEKRRNPVMLQHGMTIGSASAETDDEFLFDCFVHYTPVTICKDPKAPGMILGGRTGAGKTAILRYIAHNEEKVQEIDPFEMAMSYVSNSDVLKFVHDIGGDLDLFFSDAVEARTLPGIHPLAMGDQRRSRVPHSV